MTRGTYSGRDIVKALGNWGFRRVGQTGSHVKLEYVHPETGETRYVIVPMHDEIATGTLRSIAEQAGANNFQEFLDAIDEMV
ncbi:type II toxin-antitoxin system HicA family toxin [Natrinema hispanicum]|uniref:Predicted RNA binding protein YcfA, dsRBD-like fold, HicA-like mRNA interferase family n=1 Tax=Natrinema hispanicum TaxID=392421 RepID=A0A1I0IU61_9EURY|nr:type II toxin-antitoxin system HicA family toxin [Natrinema hispanicum]SEU00781.1 Predicted RNA binding protein YcfA, dsRBD-like fold, HicA-like mRNA interferase family [Natrinema hispanicum]